MRAFNLRLDRSRAARSLVLLFVVTATVFSALPLLRDPAATPSLITNSGTPPADMCWQAMKSISFVRANTISCIRRHARLSGRRKFARARRAHSPSCDDQLRSLVLQRETECHSTIGNRTRIKFWLYLVPSVLVIVYVWSSYHLGQPNLVLLALMLCGFVSLRAKREVVGGGFIAVAAAIKAFPVLAIVYLVYRRYWTAAGSLILTLVFLLLILPGLFRGFERAWHDLEKWSAGMLKYSELTVGQRPMRSYTWKNQSLIGVSNRLLRHVDADAASARTNPFT